MVSLTRRPLNPAEARAFVDLLARHRNELIRYHMLLPLRSPGRAANKMLLDQQAEIATIVMSDRDWFSGKAHRAKF